MVIVEHDEAIMRAAECLIGMGPEAGRHGVEVGLASTGSDLEPD